MQTGKPDGEGEPSPARGPHAYENWLSLIRGGEEFEVTEFPLFTDAPVLGAMPEGLGPYELLDIGGAGVRRVSAPRLVLRVRHYGGGAVRAITEVAAHLNGSDPSGYHGGEMQDEVAALLSLVVGARLKSGGPMRLFLPTAGSDRLGRPVAYDERRDPLLITPAPGGRPLILRATESCYPANAGNRLRAFHELRAKDASALVRAARLYQDALWIAEAQPELSWLMLVSALEVAANQWRSSRGSPLERFVAAFPDEAEGLGTLDRSLLETLAAKVADSLGSTAKFRDFVCEFDPKPPRRRPEKELRFEWEGLPEALRRIYDCRSQALHRGIPFPYPMCVAPSGDPSGPAEVPVLHATTRRSGGSWKPEDMPMLLHTFEHIARGALLNWWAKLPRPSAAEREGAPEGEEPFDLHPPSATPGSGKRPRRPKAGNPDAQAD